MRFSPVLALALVLSAAPASSKTAPAAKPPASAPPGPGANAPAAPRAPTDTDRARALFERGLERYLKGDYELALEDFNDAASVTPRAAFDFNIGRSLEKLERWGEAAAAYERYLKATPDAPDAFDVQGRVSMLRELARRGTELSVTRAVKPPTPWHRRWYVWTAVGGVVAVGLGLGLGLGLASSSSVPSAMTTDGTFRPFQ